MCEPLVFVPFPLCAPGPVAGPEAAFCVLPSVMVMVQLLALA